MTRASSAQADVQATALHGKQPFDRACCYPLPVCRRRVDHKRERERGERDDSGRRQWAHLFEPSIYLTVPGITTLVGRSDDSSSPYTSEDRIYNVTM